MPCEHPGAAQVQSVDVRELGSARSVTTPGDSQRRSGAASARVRDLRQEARTASAANVRRRQHAPHEVRLRQARRQEVLARGLVGERAVAIVPVEALRRIAEQRRAVCASPRDARPVPHEAEGERGLVVLADADRIVQLRQPALEPRRPPRSRAARARATSAARPDRPSGAAPPPAAAATRGRRDARTRRGPRRAGRQPRRAMLSRSEAAARAPRAPALANGASGNRRSSRTSSQWPCTSECQSRQP